MVKNILQNPFVLSCLEERKKSLHGDVSGH